MHNSTLGCEQLCAAQGKACIGFTAQAAATAADTICYFYEHISGYFSHDRPDVSWHPKPKMGLWTCEIWSRGELRRSRAVCAHGLR